MRSPIRNSFTGKFVIGFVSVALVSITIVGYLSLDSAVAALKQAEFQKFSALSDSQTKNIRTYLHLLTEDLVFLSQTIRIRGPFLEFWALRQARQAKTPAQATWTGSSAESIASADQKFAKSKAAADDILAAFLESRQSYRKGVEDYFLINGDDGSIFYSLRKRKELGANLKSGSLKDTSLGRLWRKVVSTHQPVMVDFAVYGPESGPSALLGVPVFSPDRKEFYGVFALRITSETISNLIRIASGAGLSARTFLVGQDRLMRTSSDSEGGSPALTKRVDSEPVSLAFKGKRGNMVVRNDHGVPVFSTYASMGLNEGRQLAADFDWAIVSEIEEAEMLRPANDLRRRILLIAIGIGIAVAGIAFVMGKGLARPIMALSQQVGHVAEGDLRLEIPGTDRDDEIGALAKAIHSLLDGLRIQIRMAVEGIESLELTGKEIAIATAQLVTGATNTSSALTETVVTIEQLKEAARTSKDKASRVAAAALESVDISESGRNATQGTASGMYLIKEQMESISETVVRLSDHSRAIETIIVSVQDLADQSNLLAVNASIEAARAGDKGKGFGVVALEIKTLAEASKQATEQIKAILAETKKWVGAVVMAAEQGGKAVEAGVAQSSIARKSIDALAHNVVDSSQAATIIQASSEQQSVAVDQVSNAMAGIRNAMEQNVAGTTQLKTATTTLEELANQLKQVVRRYHI